MFEDLKNGGSCFGHGFFFFPKLIYLWVLGRPKKMGFDLGLSAVICMYVNLSMCVQLFLKREREREIWGLFGYRVQNLLFKKM